MSARPKARVPIDQVVRSYRAGAPDSQSMGKVGKGYMYET